MSLICPKCGKTSDEVSFIGPFCTECYPVKIRCPKEIILKKCKRCNKIRLRGEWIKPEESEIGRYVISKCRGDFKEGNYSGGKAEFIIEKEGQRITVEKPIDVKYEIVTCSDCSRIAGGYFEAIIQLRGDLKKVEKFAERIVKRLQKKTFISKFTEKKEGIDINIGSTKEVILLFSEWGVKAKITRKLVGRKEGRRLYRTSFSVRL